MEISEDSRKLGEKTIKELVVWLKAWLPLHWPFLQRDFESHSDKHQILLVLFVEIHKSLKISTLDFQNDSVFQAIF